MEDVYRVRKIVKLKKTNKSYYLPQSLKFIKRNKMNTSIKYDMQEGIENGIVYITLIPIEVES